ncbi:MAG: hypothetical protein R3Y28_06000 [Candidatus Gastranaerophilales bacterium]
MGINLIRQHIDNAFTHARNEDIKATATELKEFYSQASEHPVVISRIAYRDAHARHNYIIDNMTNRSLNSSIENIENTFINPVSADIYKKEVNLKSKFSSLCDRIKSAITISKAFVEPEVDKARDAFMNTEEKLYPKTMSLRNKIVNSNRIQMDETIQKLSGLKKLKWLKENSLLKTPKLPKLFKF